MPNRIRGWLPRRGQPRPRARALHVEISKLQLAAGDILLLRVDRMSADQAAAVADLLMPHLPYVKALVIPACEISVLTPAP